MDGTKQFLYSILISISLISLVACQEKKETPSKVIDDTNSRFSTKGCYGQAIVNSYIVHWKNGKTTIVKNMTKDAIVAKYISDIELENAIDFIEQDRMFKFNDGIITAKQIDFQKINDLFKFNSEQAKSLDENYFEPPAIYWGQKKTEAYSAWSENILGEGVVVAIIDSGIDIKHPQLKNQLAINEGEIPDNWIDDDNNGLIDDYHGYDFKYNTPKIKPIGAHGTHVAGIIAADPNFGPMHGVAPKAKIIPINFMSDDENSSGSLTDAISAMEYAIERKAKIVNASWGGAPCSDSLKKEIDKYSENNILFIVAAGNSGVNLSNRPEYPAAFKSPSQITVGAIAPSDRMTGFSNYSSKLVDLMAPGFEIWSTIPLNKYFFEAPLVYPLSGTSMAAPFVSGAAALLWSKHPEAKAFQIKEAILKSVDEGNYQASTKGRLNIKRALEVLKLKNAN